MTAASQVRIIGVRQVGSQDVVSPSWDLTTLHQLRRRWAVLASQNRCTRYLGQRTGFSDRASSGELATGATSHFSTCQDICLLRQKLQHPSRPPPPPTCRLHTTSDQRRTTKTGTEALSDWMSESKCHTHSCSVAIDSLMDDSYITRTNQLTSRAAVIQRFRTSDQAPQRVGAYGSPLCLRQKIHMPSHGSCHTNIDLVAIMVGLWLPPA